MALPFGEWSIEENCFKWILDHLPDGSTLVELGSGIVTPELCKHYKVYSIEDDLNFIKRDYLNNWIYAPLKDDWYDRDIIKAFLPETYDMLLIDGPHDYKRPNLHKNLDLFDWSKPVVLDDMQEEGQLHWAKILANEVCKRPYEVIKGEFKSFMVIP